MNPADWAAFKAPALREVEHTAEGWQNLTPPESFPWQAG